MDFRDHYAELGVSRTATADEIKKAFRTLARKYHPDANQGDASAEERFKRVSEAYDVLSDADKRAKYDTLSRQYEQFRSQGGRGGNTTFDAFRQTGGQGAAGGSSFSDVFGGMSMDDLLSQLFGSGGTSKKRSTRTRPERRQTPVYSVTLSLEEAFTGVTKRLTVGATTVDMAFRPGIATGQRLNVPNGHLDVTVAPHPRFTRNGDDLQCTDTIPLTTALLGGKHTVRTLQGTIAMTIPAGCQNGRTFRLKGLGMPVYGSPERRGDLYVTVEVSVPSTLTDEQRILVEKLAASGL